MKLSIDKFYNDRENFIKEATDRIDTYFNNKEYITNNLNLYVSFDDEEKETDSETFLMYSFNIWGELYKISPEFLVFVDKNILIEIVLSYHLFAKTKATELYTFSMFEAEKKGIAKSEIDKRCNENYKLIENY